MWGLNKVILSDGRQFPTDDGFAFDSQTYHFYYNNQDITNLISRTQKKALVSGFDDQLENDRLNLESGRGTGGATSIQPLNDDNLEIFAGQMMTDPLAAPIESFGNTIDSVISNPAYKALGAILLIGIGLFVMVKLSK